MTDPLIPLRFSVEQLRALVEPFGPEQLRSRAYPSEWTIADTLSHLGSGAVIFVQNIDSAVTGDARPDGFNESVWDEWNAKSPDEQWADLPTADAAVLARLAALSEAERDALKVSLGPIHLDYAGTVAMRLNEHALHTWDIAVVLDPATVLPPEVVETLLAAVEIISHFAAKPTGSTRTYIVRIEEPSRTYRIELTPEAVSIGAGVDSDVADVTLPAEAFVRLTSGRLDADHTPAGISGVEHLDELRRVFPGF
jgi:uncharacterized protein (TIGR03083 family)